MASYTSILDPSAMVLQSSVGFDYSDSTPGLGIDLTGGSTTPATPGASQASVASSSPPWLLIGGLAVLYFVMSKR